jgi:hypothetical protein
MQAIHRQTARSGEIQNLHIDWLRMQQWFQQLQRFVETLFAVHRRCG